MISSFSSDNELAEDEVKDHGDSRDPHDHHLNPDQAQLGKHSRSSSKKSKSSMASSGLTDFAKKGTVSATAFTMKIDEPSEADDEEASRALEKEILENIKTSV